MADKKKFEEQEIETEVDEVIEEEETEPEVEETKFSKFKAGLKRNGKRILTIGAVAAAALIGYGLGKKKNSSDDVVYYLPEDCEGLCPDESEDNASDGDQTN